MVQVKLKKIGVLFVLVCLAMTIAIAFSTFSYADAEATGDEEEITVYFTINDEKGYLVGNDDAHTVMYRVPVKLKYVDLADYGLQKYYRYKAQSYEEGGNYLPEAIENKDIVKQPTVLMLYLKVLSKYYLNREITKADIGDTELKALVPANQAPTSFFMNFFWNHGENLLYYVNHEYPLMHEGWGATADYILLTDGDDVEVQLMPGSEINSFQKFETEEMTVTQETEISSNLQRLGSNIYTGSGTVSYPLPDYYIRYSMDYGHTWKVTDIKSDEDGNFTFAPEEAGVCYLSTSQYKSSANWHCGLPTSIIHVTPEQIHDADCYMTQSGEIGFVFDAVKGAEGYNIFYREQGASDWSKTRADTNEFVLQGAKAGTAYEFKASAYVTDKYVLPNESYRTLTGEESDVITYSMTDDPAVLNVIERMALVPVEADVQLADRGVIEAARAAYAALDDAQKQHIASSDVTRLEAAEERLAELQAEKDARDKQEATTVTNMITALPSVANVTFEDKDEVNAAYDAYQALSPEGKALIKSISLNKLTQLKAKIDAWQEEEDTANANHVRELINALPPLSTVKLSDKAKVYAAYDAYQALTDGAKAKIGDYYTSKLSDLKEKVDKLQKEADEKAAREKAAKEALAKKKAAAKKYATTGLKVKAKSRKFTVSWNKTKGATGYQVQYKLKAAKKWSALKTTKSLKAVSKKLKKGKKYSFRVRTYTVLSGSKVYGKWSGVKTAKCR